MSVIDCRICGVEATFFTKATIMDKYDVSYFICKKCGLLQTELPYWLSEAYRESINRSDIGILQRNIEFSKKTAVLLYTLFDTSYKCLDYAGGYGIFCRLMRDLGFDFFWYDPFTENIFAKGFEYDSKNHYDFLTSFESFEHFVYPMMEFKKMIDMSENILVSTTLYPSDIPAPENWWYYGLDHGQHVAFYSEKTLRYMADYFGLHFFTDGRYLHLFVKEIPRLRKLNPFLKVKYAIMGHQKINRILKEAEKIFPYVHRKLPKSKITTDVINQCSKID